MTNGKKDNIKGILDELMVTGKDIQILEDNASIKKIYDDSTNLGIDHNQVVPTE